MCIYVEGPEITKIQSLHRDRSPWDRLWLGLVCLLVDLQHGLKKSGLDYVGRSYSEFSSYICLGNFCHPEDTDFM